MTQKSPQFGHMMRAQDATLARRQLEHNVCPETLDIVGVGRQKVAADHILGPLAECRIPQCAVLPTRELFEQLISPGAHRVWRHQSVVFNQGIKLCQDVPPNGIALQFMHQSLLKPFARRSGGSPLALSRCTVTQRLCALETS